MSKEKINLTDSLKKLNAIVDWFESQQDIDVEAGLEKVREAAALIKSSKGRLIEVENEFKEIEKEIGEETYKEEKADDIAESSQGTDEDVNLDDIPF